MAITATVLTEAASTAATPYATVSITPTAGRVLLVLAQIAGIGTATASTVSGLSGTWTNVGGSNRFNTSYDLSAHWCTDYTGSGALTITNSDAGTHGIWCVIEVNGADTTTPVVAGSFQFVNAGSVNSVSITLNAAANANNRPFAAFGCDNNTAGQAAPRASWTEFSDRGIGTPTGVMETQWRSDAFETTASVAWTGGPYTSGGIALEVAAAAAGQTIAVNQATSTETAQPITRAKARTVGQAVEVDTSRPLAKRILVAQPVETDTAQAVTRVKTRTIGQGVETSTAQPVVRGGTFVNLTIETDAARPVTHLKTRAVGQSVSTETAQPVTARKTRALGQAVETDTAQPVAHTKAKLLGQSTETSTAQPVGHAKARLIGQTVEDDAAQKLVGGALGQVVEQDMAQLIRPVKFRIVGQAVSTETPQSIAHAKLRTVAQIVEQDTATGIVRVRSRLLGQASTTETAFSVARTKTRTLGLTLETDAALVIGTPVVSGTSEPIDRPVPGSSLTPRSTSGSEGALPPAPRAVSTPHPVPSSTGG